MNDLDEVATLGPNSKCGSIDANTPPPPIGLSGLDGLVGLIGAAPPLKSASFIRTNPD